MNEDDKMAQLVHAANPKGPQVLCQNEFNMTKNVYRIRMLNAYWKGFFSNL